MAGNGNAGASSKADMDDARRRTLLRLAQKIQEWANSASDLEMRGKLLEVATELVLLADKPEPNEAA